MSGYEIYFSVLEIIFCIKNYASSVKIKNKYERIHLMEQDLLDDGYEFCISEELL